MIRTTTFNIKWASMDTLFRDGLKFFDEWKTLEFFTIIYTESRLLIGK